VTQPTFDFSGQVVVVTGGSRGVGAGIVAAFVAAGAHVVTCGRNEAEVPGAVFVVADVRQPDQAALVVDTAVERFGRLDVLVNNAGIVRDAMLFSMTEDDFDSVVRVHLKGTFATTHHASVYWREASKAGNQPRAAIVNTVSSAGLQGNVGQANYGAAKAGIAALTVISSLELARYGVRANAVAPGGMTRITGTLMKEATVIEPQYEEGEFERMNPRNSAPMVAWLASDEALHVTGQVFRAVGHTITHYQPWSLGPSIEPRKGPAKWDPADIGAAVNAHIFGSRAPGLQIGG
jgi:NAD(P)-dependent dehydrogenase (short-subunit alcohol dehydrogenase family)